MLADKLPVGKQAVDAVRSEQADVALQQRDPLLGVGVPFLWQHAEHQRVGHTVLALHRADIKSDRSFMCAKLMFFPKKPANVSEN